MASGTANADTVTVAFIGDQSTHQGARDVLYLVRDEGTDLLVIQGDFGYSSPSRWIANHEEILGPRFPVLGVVGNHEEIGWPTYQRWLEQRIEDVPDLHCEGRVGVKAHCTFRGLSIVQGAPGIHEVSGVSPNDDYAGYIERAFADDPNVWRICSWHKQQRDMQVGGKNGNATGWGVYEACREAGAIVATAHEHSYSRTFLMSDFSELQVAHRGDHLDIGPGRSFAFVSGLGGNSVRPQLRDGDWWASIYTATQGATHGALFCTFEGRQASCRFKAIDGAVPDRFTLETRNGLEPPIVGGGSSDGPGGEGVRAAEDLRAEVYSTSAAELFWSRADRPGMRYEVTLDGNVVASTDGTSHFIVGLAAARSYVYEVVAIDPEGRRSTPVSVMLRTLDGGGAPAEPPPPVAGTGELPGAPDALRAEVYSTSAAELFWSRADRPGMRYEVTLGGNVVATSDGVSHFIVGLAVASSYVYEVVAIDPEGRRSAPASVTLRTPGEGGVPAGEQDVVLGSTTVLGDIEVRLDVYDRSSYELFWARVTGASRYRLSSSDGQVLQDGEKVSRYFSGIDPSAVTDYRIEAIDASGQRIRDTTFRVVPRQSAQLVSLDPVLGEVEASYASPDVPAPTADDRRRREACAAGRLPAAPICRATH